MKKLINTLIIIIFAAALSFTVFACGKDEIETASVSVRFFGIGGTELETMSGKIGSELTMLKPEWPHYEFLGWYSDRDLTVKFTSNVFPNADLDLYSEWRALSAFEIKFDTKGGSNIRSIFKEEGEVIQAPAIPEREGYNFIAWYKNETLTEQFAFNLMPAENFVLYAKWERDPSKALVNFYGNNEIIKTVFVVKGGEVSANGIFAQDIEFSAWKDSQGASFDFGGKINQDISLYTSFYSKNLVYDKNNIIDYLGNSENVVLPESYGGYEITGIGDSAFSKRAFLKKISLNGKIKTVAPNAFYECANLIEITNTDSIETLGEYAFFGCRKLIGQKSNINNTYNLDISSVNIINEGTFNGCAALSDIAVSPSLSRIGAYAFANCVALKELEVGDRLERAEDFAFLSCTTLKKFYIGTDFVSLGKGALQNCLSLTEFTISTANNYYSADENNNVYSKDKTILIFYNRAGAGSVFEVPSGVTKIESSAFLGNTNITHIKLPASLRDAFGVLSYCQNLTEITMAAFSNEIPFLAHLYGAKTGLQNGKTGVFVPSVLKKINFTNITKIPDYAFYGCTGITEINGLDRLTDIGNYSFAYNKAFTTFNISDSLRSIGDGAFEGCNISSFNIAANNPNFAKSQNFLYNTMDKALIKVSVLLSEFDYANPEFGGALSGMRKVSGYAFENCIVDLISLPSSVIEIGAGAFARCSDLKKIVMPIESILTEDRLFDSLFGTTPYLKELKIIGSPVSIPDFAFTYCNIENIILPESVTYIGEEAFSNSNQLLSVSGMKNLKVIGDGAFFNCVLLKDVEIGNSLEEIGFDAFRYCYELKTFTLPNSLKIIGAYAFWYCENFTAVVFEDITKSSLVDIQACAFIDSGISGALVLPVSILKIGMAAFEGTLITSVSFMGTPTAGITISLESLTFASCSLLKTVTFPDNYLLTLGRYTFSYCEALESVYLGNIVDYIGDFAFVRCAKLLNFTLPATVKYVGQDITRGTAWRDSQANGILYKDNTVVGYKGAINDTEIVFAQTVAGKQISVICTAVFWSIHPDYGYYEENITKITIPEGYKYISNNAMPGLKKLSTLILPSTLEKIGDYAFNNCTALTEVIVGSSANGSALKSIESYAFALCTNLVSFRLYKNVSNASDVPSLFLANYDNYGVKLPDGKVSVSSFMNSSKVVFYVPAASIAHFEQAWNIGYSHAENFKDGPYFKIRDIATA